MKVKSVSKQGIQQDFDEMRKNEIFTPEYKRARLRAWGIRTLLSVALYAIFWKYAWVRWSLWVSVPLTVLSLVMVIGMPYLLKRRLEKFEKEMKEIEAQIAQNSPTKTKYRK